uniref:Knottin scorpion toxin-like domain-containing protein n=1 Tax=Oryza nivara TaxID=4536 RepID=A0A0E0I6Y1_ORYNI
MKPVVALFLVTVLIASHGAMMQWAAEAETCNYPIYKCEGVCYKRGKCNACCKQLGFLGGMLCLCCHEDDDQPPPSSTHLPVAAIDHDHDHAADMP